MKKKLALLLAVCAVCGMCASCGEDNSTDVDNNGVISQQTVVEEDLLETIEIDGEELPGPDETTVIISTVMNINHDDEEVRNANFAAKDGHGVITAKDIFGKESESGVDFVNAVITETKTGDDIAKLDVSKLKGEVSDYHIVTVSVMNNDDLTEKDMNFGMVLIDDAWYILDITEAQGE